MVDGTALTQTYRSFVARLRARAIEADAERVAHWAKASPEEHAKALADLVELTDVIVRSRGRPIEKPPLPDERFPWPSLRRTG